MREREENVWNGNSGKDSKLYIQEYLKKKKPMDLLLLGVVNEYGMDNWITGCELKFEFETQPSQM